jgi:hypothetical protein
MPPHERAKSFASAPLDELWGVLLHQMKRPLASHSVILSDAAARDLGVAIAAQSDHPQRTALQAVLPLLVAESEAALTALKAGLTFEKSLDLDMDALGGWETTADFIERATQKSNAELRITLGSALLYALGDARYSAYLHKLAAGDYGDESAIARRALDG